MVTKQKVPVAADAASDDPCPVAPVADLVLGRWTTHVLWVLAHHGRLRFGELQRLVPGVTPKVLTERLRQLERNGFVSRTYHREVPPRVEYEPTDLGLSLGPVFAAMSAWSEQHLASVHAAQRRHDDRAAATSR